MVVIPKSNGEVRICVDLTKLNASSFREVHLLPLVDYTLAKFDGVKLFSKMDAIVHCGRENYQKNLNY